MVRRVPLPAGRALRRGCGFTYVSLIILVAIIGLVAAATLKLGATVQRSRAEQELLWIGAAFSDALQSYADATPAGQLPQPATLKDLLRDPRFPTPRRHLRKLYVDPITGSDQWGIVYLNDKSGVLAVYSLSNARPVKVGNFPQRFQGLAGKQKLSEWRFGASGPASAMGPGGAPAPQPGVPGTPGAPGMPSPQQPEPVPEVQPAQPPAEAAPDDDAAADTPPATPAPEEVPAPEPQRDTLPSKSRTR